MKHFNCYVSGKNGWINLNKINTYLDYVTICDDYYSTKFKLTSFKIVLGFGFKQIIAKNLAILLESDFNLFQEYKNWNDVMKEAFNVYLNEYRANITSDKISHFAHRFIGEFESREEFAIECATQVDFIEEWEKVKDYFNIEKYTDELFEDFIDIKHPTKNSIFVFRKR